MSGDERKTGSRLLGIEPLRFNRLCALLSLVFLVATLGYRWYRGTSDQDFPQYYMGGVMARLAAWDQLYPIPREGATRNPGFIEDSTLKPRYADEMRKRVPSGDGVRYMQPPPFALLLVPLSFLKYEHAYAAWMTLMLLCTWGIAIQAGIAYRACLGRVSCVSGLITLLVAASPAAHRWVRVMNMSSLVGLAIGLAVLGLLHNRAFTIALSTWLGGLAKYANGVLVPLMVAMRQWKALVILAGVSLISLLIALGIMGRAPFDEYFRVIAPTLKNTNTLPANQALQGFVARAVHGAHTTEQIDVLQRTFAGKSLIPSPVMLAITAAQLLLLLLILGLIFSHWRGGAQNWRSHPPLVFASAGALLCWLLIFSPMYWEHYTAYLAPLWGWAIWEARQSRLRAFIVVLMSVLMYVPVPVLFKDIGDPWAAHILWATMLMLGLAVSRLWVTGRGIVRVGA